MTLPNRPGYQVSDSHSASTNQTQNSSTARKGQSPVIVGPTLGQLPNGALAFPTLFAPNGAPTSFEQMKNHFGGFLGPQLSGNSGNNFLQNHMHNGPMSNNNSSSSVASSILSEFTGSTSEKSNSNNDNHHHFMEFPTISKLHTMQSHQTSGSSSSTPSSTSSSTSNSAQSSSSGNQKNSADSVSVENYTPEELSLRKSYVRAHRLLPNTIEVLNSCRKEGMLWEPKIDQTLVTAMMPPITPNENGLGADQSIEDFLHSQGIETCPLNSEDPQKNLERQEFVTRLEQLKEKYAEELEKLDRVCNDFCFGMLNLLREQVTFRPVTDQETQMKILGIQYRFHNVKNKLRQNVFTAILQIHKQYNQARKKKRMLPKKATESLSAWFFEHINDPYPSEEEKSHLASLAGLTLTQVNNWFGNKRIRYKRKCLEEDNKTRNRRGQSVMMSDDSPPPSQMTLKDKQPSQQPVF